MFSGPSLDFCHSTLEAWSHAFPVLEFTVNARTTTDITVFLTWNLMPLVDAVWPGGCHAV